MEPAWPAAELRSRRELAVRAHMQAEMSGDIPATLATFADEPEYDIVPLGGLRRGNEEVHEVLANLLGAFPDLGLHVVVLRHTADAVVIEGRMTGTHTGPYGPFPPRGHPLDLRAAILFHFDVDGADLRRETVYYDELTLLVQIGAVPSPA